MGLAAIAGESHVVSEPAACAAMAVGAKVPRYVVYPPSAESVAAVLKFAANHDLAVIPCCHGTKRDLGNPPRRYDLALSLKELNQVRYFEPADLTTSVDAGMGLGDFQRLVGREGLWLPLDPLGGERASVGGILATNSAGPLRLRFGTARDMVLGIKVATTEGKLVKSGGRVVKNVAGYDLCKLLIGSYGTLAVIVEASFKLFPRPATRATFVLQPGTLAIARDLRRRILNSPLDPLRMVLFDGEASILLRNGLPPGEAQGLELWVEAGGSPQVLHRYVKDLNEMGRSMGVSCRQLNDQTAESCWGRLTEREQLFAESFPEVMVLKATLPLASTEEFLSFAQQMAAGEEVKLAGFAQVGVGTVHLGVWGEKLGAAVDRLLRSTRQAAADLGGTLVVEHYADGFNGERDTWGPPGDALEAMRGLKAVWDPKGILSPGRFVGGI
jgi:glycolate oxidase FAD binding subunit